MNYKNVVLLAISVKQGMEKVGFFQPPYGAPEHRKALGVRPAGVDNRRLATGPRGRDDALGQCREPKAAERRTVRHEGALSFGFFSLREQRKETRPRCGEPQVNTRAKPAR